ncbi:hypothetical protein CANARDRAFT_28072 [[Candida] arabinofermentans NRRL YB-2248]|uniref:Phosphoribosylaminoimidazole-succinocarboxamide synthase n=1 Tax=[Candida] arabinofermentans NRRL YB-2248 TaxID=983967 RepID=A0A1E4T2M8_9ASCO|nr:hypothetical protein CANARDRAFT_28072 [[Candida] arabinofermentans NRRL YB-2248]
MSVTTTNLDGILPLLARGKVRDIYTINENYLLFVATDRISAYDVIMNNGIKDKGIILTKLSIFWFNLLQTNIKNHIVAFENDEIFKILPNELSEAKYKSQLQDRCLIVQKYDLIPLEVIVRGYITGSAWKEYKQTKTVHGSTIDYDLKESESFKKPIFTPSTKAEQGEHDENISIAKATDLIGVELCEKLSDKAIELYTKAKDYSVSKGIILADTKFEFGLTKTNELVLVDEVLTPDSSRFWNLENYKIGESQDSYDKQFLRDWLTHNQLNGVENVTMPDDIVEKTRLKYIEAYESLTGEKYSN